LRGAGGVCGRGHCLILERVKRLGGGGYSEKKGSRRFLRNVYTYGNCALLVHYAASSGNSLPTFRDNLSAPSSRFKGTDRLSRNVCKELPLLAA